MTNDLKIISVTIQGKTPLLCHRFSDAAAMDASSGGRSAMTGERKTPIEAARECLFLQDDDDKKPYLPQPNILRCITDGGIFFKEGKSKITTQKSSLISACVSIEELAIPIKSEGGWHVDSRAVRIPATGGRITRHRAIFHDWELSFTIGLDTSILSVARLRDVIDAAGVRIGLGDFRPACKGPFGKFVVTHWGEQNRNR